MAEPQTNAQTAAQIAAARLQATQRSSVTPLPSRDAGAKPVLLVDRILDALVRAQRPMSSKDIAEAVNAGAAVSPTMRTLFDRGLVDRRLVTVPVAAGTGQTARAYQYRINEAGLRHVIEGPAPSVGEWETATPDE